MHHDLTNGNITRSLLWFAFPIMVGNLLQQFYNVVDTLIVGQFLGKEMRWRQSDRPTPCLTFLTSILLEALYGKRRCFFYLLWKERFCAPEKQYFLAFLYDQRHCASDHRDRIFQDGYDPASFAGSGGYL